MPDPKDPNAAPAWPYKQTFLTSPVFESQAKQFLKWKSYYSYIDFVVHGKSLTAAINEIQDEIDRPKHPLLVKPLHKSLNRELHLREQKLAEFEEDTYYGTSGSQYAGDIAVLIGSMLKKSESITVLDYGCGKCTLEDSLPPIKRMEFFNYDPCIPEHEALPEPADRPEFSHVQVNSAHQRYLRHQKCYYKI